MGQESFLFINGSWKLSGLANGLIDWPRTLTCWSTCWPTPYTLPVGYNVSAKGWHLDWSRELHFSSLRRVQMAGVSTRLRFDTRFLKPAEHQPHAQVPIPQGVRPEKWGWMTLLIFVLWSGNRIDDVSQYLPLPPSPTPGGGDVAFLGDGHTVAVVAREWNPVS